MTSLSGKVAVVTGAARGQGRSHAVLLAEAGADVIALDICEQISSVSYPMSTWEDLEETAALVEKTGQRVSIHKVDVRERDLLKQVVGDAVGQFGRLDYVVANAGILPSAGENNDSIAAWHDSVDVILTGTLNTLDACYPTLIEQGEGGSIVITGSMAALQPMMRTERGRTLGLLGYSAAKLGLVSLMQNYASFLANSRVRVNIIHPTGVVTPMVVNDAADAQHAFKAHEDLQVLINAIDVRMVEVEDISHLVVYLCSDESRYITGTAIRVDAGASLR